MRIFDEKNANVMQTLHPCGEISEALRYSLLTRDSENVFLIGTTICHGVNLMVAEHSGYSTKPELYAHGAYKINPCKDEGSVRPNNFSL